MTSRVSVTATSGLARFEAALQIAAPIHRYRTPTCTGSHELAQSADRSTEMNEPLGSKKFGSEKKKLDYDQPSHRSR